eukprot:gnl/TRDRNA2_/TRDRNA2_80108_c0_seq1.p1 gnl/TRDRNA2_/TRDRNA2_80108_c0~~gnl/TRDRNA2_/TRDRNA2_80108_c0_seq1.p1  ORF type:complete len:468 (+),score=92.98 gnl/TRDRNA2_/TRDRNA2_80108_c0_seq1:119-1522(+)
MTKDCTFGVVAMIEGALGAMEKHLGQEAARALHLKAESLLASREHLMQSGCSQWELQVNRAGFVHASWFLARQGERQFPCGDTAIRIFVDEREEWKGLRSNPLLCAGRGLCFTEVWLHQFLRHAICRADTPEEADLVYVPIYSACHSLDRPELFGLEQELEAFYAEFGDRRSSPARAGGSLPPLLLVLTGEQWKLRGWHDRLRHRAKIAAVEAKPLLISEVQERSSSERRHVQHCEDCFDRDHDIVIPSAVLPVDVARLRYYNLPPEKRELVAVFHGEHAKSKVRDEVAEGYREVNETVRLALLEHFGKKPKASVGAASLRYSFLMGNTHFCLIPRGRGWWTVRLFEAFYAGCIPVILSDEQVLPFEDFLDWEQFSIKWPMKRVGDGLYEHLERLIDHHWEAVSVLHAGVRKVACWFDYHAPQDADCSPYIGLLRQLGRRKVEAAAAVPRQHDISKGRNRAVQRYWF